MHPADVRSAIDDILPALRNDGTIVITLVAGGGNNRLFRIKGRECDYIAKFYFKHEHDTRDRLAAEFIFSTFVWHHGIRCIAEPVASDSGRFVGIYRYVEGRKLCADDITWCEVDQALSFLREINRHRSSEDALRLPPGSEACFSLGEHIRTIDARLERLNAIVCEDDLDRGAHAFVQRDLRKAWRRLREELLLTCAQAGIGIDERLDPADTVISPSDFGFQNALANGQRKLTFIDFEYAGWDDPAKMVGDFFNQVAVPVPLAFFGPFAETVASWFPNPARTLARIRMLLPLYRIKWCCIVLNHFLPVDRNRKQFADEGALAKREAQLDKAKILLDTLHTTVTTGG